MRRFALALALALAALSMACGTPDFFETGPCENSFSAAAIATCSVPGFDGRDYDLVLPDAYDPDTPVPLVIAIHGGGGNRQSQEKTSCSAGEVDDASCMHALARERGYAVVFPDGTSAKLAKKLRTWNAGGGTGDWRCTSGRACEEDVDDVAYFSALLDDVGSRVNVDPNRVFATGLSNGGAMSHRLACELSDRIVAIAAVGGAMQLTTSDVCEPTQPVGVLHIHGTEDPCWRYGGGVPDCPTGQRDLAHVSVDRTMSEWSVILGCDEEPTTDTLKDTHNDGTETNRHTWAGCTAALEHLEIEGGGHTWPDGHQYLGEATIGPVPRDFGSEVILDFFDANPRQALP